MRPYILAETNWHHIKNAKFNLAVLPWGAVEAHNYHLPYSSDVIESKAIAAESARIAWEKGARLIVLPPIPYGVNTGQTDIYLDMNLSPSTQQAILRDLVTVLNRQGIHKLMLLNSHGGNEFKPMLRELGLEFQNMFLCTANWFEALDRSDFFTNPGDHAEEMETSLLLYLNPELVLAKKKWGNGQVKSFKIKEFSEHWLWTERKWSKITADTGVGNPQHASKDKGERFFRAVTEKIADVLFELCRMDPENMYE
ncbi:MAG: creatininase family protein [candidate division KSB1 bacterium]|nr:creatininase family protein [candidate division KSB1 bacterium]